MGVAPVRRSQQEALLVHWSPRRRPPPSVFFLRMDFRGSLDAFVIVLILGLPRAGLCVPGEPALVSPIAA